MALDDATLDDATRIQKQIRAAYGLGHCTICSHPVLVFSAEPVVCPQCVGNANFLERLKGGLEEAAAQEKKTIAWADDPWATHPEDDEKGKPRRAW